MRQKLFILNDLISEICGFGCTRIYSGSLAEGLDLPGSDYDCMYVLKDFTVVQNLGRVPCRLGVVTFLIEYDDNHPGFSKLKLIRGDEMLFSPLSFIEIDNGKYLCSVAFLNSICSSVSHMQLTTHGPCLSDIDLTFDNAFCFHLRSWPEQAKAWIYRHRSKEWPSDRLVENIVGFGCLIVPVCPKYEENETEFWRISFSMAEKQLCHSFNYVQFLCYSLLKLTLKNIINKNVHARDMLCSYFMKTALFWVSEEISIEYFRISNLYLCFCLCIDKLLGWIYNCYCPNYFIPEHNMFKGKINESNNKMLYTVLNNVRFQAIGRLCSHATKTFMRNKIVLPTIRQYSNADLEILFYRIVEISTITSVAKGFKVLSLIKNMSFSMTSSVLKGVYHYYYCVISQQIAHMIPVSLLYNKTHYMFYRRFFNEFKESDAVSGWVLYASYHYILGHYNAALKIVEYVLSRCSTNLLVLSCPSFKQSDIKQYQSISECEVLTLTEKMKLSTSKYVQYYKKSSLIPHEFKLDNQDNNLNVSCDVMSSCIKFLCYHHLNEIENKEQSLSDLRLSVYGSHMVAKSHDSVCFTLLGVCYEIAGNKESAKECYTQATRCTGMICKSASNRLMTLTGPYIQYRIRLPGTIGPIKKSSKSTIK